MKQQFKLFAICAALVVTLPSVSAQSQEVIEATFKYDHSAPVETTYRKAQRTAYKACDLNGRLAEVKRALSRSCIRPLIEEFVIATEDSELLAYHQRRTGRAVRGTRFVAH